MSIKGKLIYEAMDEIYRELGANGGIPMDLIKRLMSRLYDAGKVDSTDDDASRWGMFLMHFGSLRARRVRDVYMPPALPLVPPHDRMPPNLSVNRGSEWRLDCAWIERSGEADTIPKFIDLMCAARRAEEKL